MFFYREAAISLLSGEISRGMVGNVRKSITKKIGNNPNLRAECFDGYIVGLNKNKFGKELADYRGAVQNNFNGNK